MMKSNKGFILIMTLVMALVMLIICFVCLKIFLAPYVAIQSDIIKKKEFYMADTAIEIIREQISNTFFDFVGTEPGWEHEINEAKYFATSLKQQFDIDFNAEEEFDDDLINSDLAKKYNGNICNTVSNDYTLPIKNKPLIIISSNNIDVWENWDKWHHEPSTGTYYNSSALKNELLDKNLSVTAFIEQIKITDDKTISTATCSGDDFFYEYDPITGNFKDNGISKPALFLPKELQDGDDKKLFLGHNNLSNFQTTYLVERIKRRDFVIEAVSSYYKSNIKCKMRYYFTLISLSPKEGDHISYWNRGVIGHGDDGTLTNIRVIYRFYFRKLEYEWTEEDD